MGSWISYGLGSETRDLPAFVVLMDKEGAPVNGALNWTNGYMPASYQGVPFRSSGPPIVHLSPPGDVDLERQKARLGLLRKWNLKAASNEPAESGLAASWLASEPENHKLSVFSQVKSGFSRPK